MPDHSEILETARKTLVTEGEALLSFSQAVGESFARLVERIATSNGRIHLSGVGKSALVAQRIAASLNSTGIAASFLHAGDAVHGDLGSLQPGDQVLFLSKSGNTPEIKALAPYIRSLGFPVLAIVSDRNSFLEQFADLTVIAPIEREACPDNLVPTTSTILQSAIGDALVVCLLKIRGYSKEKFSRAHPGGIIGKRLNIRVSDLYPSNEKPLVADSATIREVIVEISSKRLGATAVSDPGGAVTGIITDGDLRRMLEKHGDTQSIRASDIMTRNPRCIAPDQTAVHALEMMRSAGITQLLVMREEQYLGVIHIHDILREGIN
ncbi:MAG: KpsF/GutQ family sugar-phosphate isomerase [Bacteroidales bacterium]